MLIRARVNFNLSCMTILMLVFFNSVHIDSIKQTCFVELKEFRNRRKSSVRTSLVSPLSPTSWKGAPWSK